MSSAAHRLSLPLRRSLWEVRLEHMGDCRGQYREVAARTRQSAIKQAKAKAERLGFDLAEWTVTDAYRVPGAIYAGI